VCVGGSIARAADPFAPCESKWVCAPVDEPSTPSTPSPCESKWVCAPVDEPSAPSTPSLCEWKWDCAAPLDIPVDTTVGTLPVVPSVAVDVPPVPAGEIGEPESGVRPSPILPAAFAGVPAEVRETAERLWRVAS
jgi:hypothetical protein